MSPFAVAMTMGEFLVATFLFSYRLPKRNFFVLRLIGSIATSLGLCYLVAHFVPSDSWIRFLIFTFEYVLCAASVFVCFKTNVLTALATGACGFATQHFAYNLSSFVGVWWSLGRVIQPPNMFLMNLLELLIYKGPVYVLFFFLFARKLRHENYDDRDAALVSILSIATVLVCVGISRFARDVARDQSAILAESLYAMVCCFAALALFLVFDTKVKLQRNDAVLRHLLAEEKKQFEAKKEDAELLHVKIHDLRHRIKNLNTQLSETELASLKDAIKAYDAPFKTGNQALDIILTGVNTSCLSKKISLTFMGDGSKLDFLEEDELYSLVENALDNAIDAVSGLDPESRHISMTIGGKGDLVVVEVINYYKGNLSFKDGVPLTTRQDDVGFHGYGMVSMRRVAEKYSGGISVKAENGIFSLSIYMERNVQ